MPSELCSPAAACWSLGSGCLIPCLSCMLCRSTGWISSLFYSLKAFGCGISLFYSLKAVGCGMGTVLIFYILINSERTPSIYVTDRNFQFGHRPSLVNEIYAFRQYFLNKYSNIPGASFSTTKKVPPPRSVAACHNSVGNQRDFLSDSWYVLVCHSTKTNFERNAFTFSIDHGTGLWTAIIYSSREII